MLKDIAKKYLPLAILFVLVVAILCMSRYAETRKQHHQNNAHHVNRTATVTPDQATDSAKEANKTDDSPSWIETFAWPNGVAVWALLLTLFVIAWQSTEARDAAKGAQRAADASFTQIEMTRDKERAKLRFELDAFDPRITAMPSGYHIHATVSIFGSTEAYIEKTILFAGIMREDESEIGILPAPMAEIPNVIRSGSDPLKTWTILFRTNPMHLWVPSEGEEIEDVLSGKSLMFCKGSIHYSDVFGEKWVCCFSRCYRVYLIPDGRYAGGYWDDFGTKDENGEYEQLPNPN